MTATHSEVSPPESAPQDQSTVQETSSPSANPHEAGDSTTDTSDETSEDPSNVDTLKRDYIIFLVAMTILCGGLADGLIRGFGVSPWIAVPAGIAVWGGIFQSIYRKYQAL